MSNLSPEISSLGESLLLYSQQGVEQQRVSTQALLRQNCRDIQAPIFPSERNPSGALASVIAAQSQFPSYLPKLSSGSYRSGRYSEWTDAIHYNRADASVIEVRRSLIQTSVLDSLLQQVKQLERRGRIDAALDVLYDRVDGLLRSNKFEALDDALGCVNTVQLTTDVIIGLLTASLPAKSKLPSRARFFATAEKTIKSRNEWEVGLLDGLQS